MEVRYEAKCLYLSTKIRTDKLQDTLQIQIPSLLEPIGSSKQVDISLHDCPAHHTRNNAPKTALSAISDTDNSVKRPPRDERIVSSPDWPYTRTY